MEQKPVPKGAAEELSAARVAIEEAKRHLS
jgi:hypothetical protein